MLKERDIKWKRKRTKKVEGKEKEPWKRTTYKD